MSNKLKVGILGGTGFVGQRFVTLLADHPYFKIAAIGASKRSAGKTYEEAVNGRWKLNIPMPDKVKNIMVEDINEVEKIADKVDFVFCAVNMPKDQVKVIEEKYAKAEVPVVSNNSANRLVPDVPMVIPEINSDHFAVIETQKKRLGTKKGFIAVKPNCSIQTYVPALNALIKFKPAKVVVSTYQAISGAGKTFKDLPEINDNVIPYIGGEEEKSEVEPLKVWGKIENGVIVPAKSPIITTQCVRVPVSDGHLATVFVTFENKPSKEEILELWKNYKGKPQELNLPSAPKKFLNYFEEPDRPQPRLDRNLEGGMGVSLGRLREDTIFDYKFIGFAHNTLRGAAGGAVLTAELLKAEGYLY